MNTWNPVFLWKQWVGQRWTLPAITKWTQGHKSEFYCLLRSHFSFLINMSSLALFLHVKKEGRGNPLICEELGWNIIQRAIGMCFWKKTRKKLCQFSKGKRSMKNSVVIKTQPPVYAHHSDKRQSVKSKNLTHLLILPDQFLILLKKGTLLLS